MVDPFLTTCCGIDEVFILDTKCGGVFLDEVLWDAFDCIELAVEVFHLIEHVLGPETAIFEVANEVGIEHDEVAGEITLHEEILISRLDARCGAHDVRDRRCWRDREDVGVTHTVLSDLFAEWLPVHFAGAWHFYFDATLICEHVECVLWHEAAVPLGTFVGAVSAVLGCDIAGGFVSVVGDGFHELVVELNGGLGSEGDVLLIECVLQTHDTETNRAVTAVGCLRGFGWIEVNIDHIIKCAHGDADRLAELFVVEVAIFIEVRVEHDGTEVTDSGFFVAGVECDLGAEIGTVDDAAVILWATDVARIFESDPRVTSLEDHLEHGLPEIDRLALLPEDFAALGHGFVFAVAFLEGFAVKLVEVGAFVGAEECPSTTVFHALHEQVWNPVGCVHVVRAATVVSGVLTQLEEIVEVVVPCFEIRTTRAATLATLVDGNELVIMQLKEWDDAL